jgi:hypothetical protein
MWYNLQACFYIAQTFPVSQLREGHRQILVPARETSQVRVTAIAGYTFLELLAWGMLNQLREDGTASVHSTIVSDLELALSKPKAAF